MVATGKRVGPNVPNVLFLIRDEYVRHKGVRWFVDRDDAERKTYTILSDFGTYQEALDYAYAQAARESAKEG